MGHVSYVPIANNKASERRLKSVGKCVALFLSKKWPIRVVLPYELVRQTQSPTPHPTSRFQRQNQISRSFPAAARPNSPAQQHRRSAAPQVRSTAAAPQPPLSPLRRDGVLLLRGLDSRLSKDLPSDLQKLRCKVAFQALKFAPRILELGNKIAETQATLFGVKVILELATKLHDDHLLTLVFSGFWIVQVHE
ncbi:hypothetical protein Ancab_028319 [Ancistrocladus abbreviatus]